MKKIILIGDFAIDISKHVRVTKLCPEAPVPVVVPVPIKTFHTDGMAGNVLANLKSMSGMSNDNLIVIKPEGVSRKTRIIDEATGYILLRIDEDYSSPPFDAYKFKSYINGDVAAVVISDYAKGFLNEGNIEFIAACSRNMGIPTFLDTKLILGEWSRDVFCVKINQIEFTQNVLSIEKPERYCRNLIVTQADKGTILLNSRGHKYFDPKKVNVADVCGAGDTMLAGLVLEYINTSNLEKAIKFANDVASFAVTKRGVYQVTQEDLKELKL